MKNVAVLCVIAFALLSPAPIEVQRGTLVVVAVSQKRDYAVVGAESRNKYGNGQPPDERGCKVIALGSDSLFFEAGHAEVKATDGQEWNAQAAARSAFQQTTAHDARELSKTWGQIAGKWFHQWNAQNFQQLSLGEEGRIITGGFLTVTDDGALSIHTEAVFYSDALGQVIAKPDDNALSKGFMYGVGTDLVQEYAHRKTQRAIDAFGSLDATRLGVDPTVDVENVRKAIQFAIDYSTGETKTELAGPVDIAILRTNRTIEWVRRKKSCYSEDQKD
jgi:hypothetical protein